MSQRIAIIILALASAILGAHAQAETLISVNFYAHLSGGLDGIKTGLAGIGHTTNDLWNHYSRDAAPGQWLSFGALSNLKTVEGVPTAAGMTIANAPGAWSNGSSDPMYNTYLYPLSGGNITVTLTNLPAGSYDFYLYGTESQYQLVAGGVDYGSKSTTNAPIVNPIDWQEDVQYVVIRNVAVADAQSATITVSPGPAGYAVISGMQIVTATPVNTNVPPIILSQPVSKSALVGSNVSFQVTAVGPGLLSYQWLFSGAPIADATTSILTLNQVQTANTGNYQVLVTNAYGSVTSAVATLTVIQPTNILVGVNFYAHLSGGLDAIKTGLAAIGHSPSDFWNHYSRDVAPFQWLSLGALANLKTVEGTDTGAGLIVANAPGAWDNGSSDAMYNTYLYPLGGGNVTITVTNLPSGSYDFYIYGSDSVYQLVAGGVDYGSKATPDAPISNPIDWQENVQYIVMRSIAVTHGQDVTLTILPGSAGYAVISGLQITVASGIGGNVPPSITSQPMGQNVGIGSDVTFSVLASGSPPFSYQWLFNSAPLTDATNYSLTLSNVQTNASGNYQVIVTNPYGSVTSAVATLSVSQLIPEIVAQPESKTVSEDTSVQFDVSATGAPTLQYQWRFNDRSIYGANASSFTLTNVQTTDAGDYSVRVFNNYGAVTSSVATLTVLHVNHPPVAHNQTVGVLAGGSTSITLSGTDIDNDPLTFSVTSSPLHGTLTGSAPNLTYQPDASYSGSDSFTFTVNDGQTDSPPATVGINVVARGTKPLLSVNFYAHLSPGLDLIKTGLADTGHSTNDYWNHYSRDVAPFQWLSFGSLSNLKTVEGLETAVGLTIANAPGAWSNGSDDPMFRTFLYPLGGGNITVNITNLPTGQYDLYVYGGDSSYQLNAGAAIYGTAGLPTNGATNPVVWQEGVQFVLFRNVPISDASQSLVLTVSPGSGGYATISGLQIASVDATNHVPIANSQIFAIDQTSTASIALTGSDLDGDALTYIVTRQPAHGTLTGTAPNLIYQPDSSYSGPDSFGFKVNDGQIDSSEASVNINVLPHLAATFLIDINFYAHLSGGLDIVKAGLAAIGHGTNDFWNHYSRDNPQGGWFTVGSLSDLKTVEGADTEAGLLVENMPGAWENGSSDAMYYTYLYPFGGDGTVTITNLPVGNYNLYVYGQDSGYHLVAGDGTDYGTLSTTNAPIINPISWQEDVQYVVFRGLQVTNVGQSLILGIAPGAGGYAVISGLQIAGTLSTEEPPLIRSIPTIMDAPLVATLAATSVSSTCAVLNATVNPNGVATTAWFDWGRTIDYGLSSVLYSLGSNTFSLPLTAALDGLSNNVTYYFRITASNSFGVRSGADLSFTWTPTKPMLAPSAHVSGEPFALHFAGAAGQTYVVLGSTNLSRWEVLGPATESSAGLFNFADNNPTNFPCRFYRVFAP